MVTVFVPLRGIPTPRSRRLPARARRPLRPTRGPLQSQISASYCRHPERTSAFGCSERRLRKLMPDPMISTPTAWRARDQRRCERIETTSDNRRRASGKAISANKDAAHRCRGRRPPVSGLPAARSAAARRGAQLIGARRKSVINVDQISPSVKAKPRSSQCAEITKRSAGTVQATGACRRQFRR